MATSHPASRGGHALGAWGGTPSPSIIFCPTTDSLPVTGCPCNGLIRPAPTLSHTPHPATTSRKTQVICYRVMARNLEGAVLGPGRPYRARSLHVEYTPTRALAVSIIQVCSIRHPPRAVSTSDSTVRKARQAGERGAHSQAEEPYSGDKEVCEMR